MLGEKVAGATVSSHLYILWLIIMIVLVIIVMDYTNELIKSRTLTSLRQYCMYRYEYKSKYIIIYNNMYTTRRTSLTVTHIFKVKVKFKALHTIMPSLRSVA